MELNIATPQGAKGTVAVSEVAFGKEFNQDLVHQAVTAYLAGARAGTRAHKTRAEVRGGGKKPWRQKGTGRARRGDIKARRQELASRDPKGCEPPEGSGSRRVRPQTPRRDRPHRRRGDRAALRVDDPQAAGRSSRLLRRAHPGDPGVDQTVFDQQDLHGPAYRSVSHLIPLAR